MKSYVSLLARLPLYNVFRRIGRPRILPVNYTFSITNMCNSRCGTCFIWKLYGEKPELKSEELTLQEWERIFAGLGKSPFWITISGGEPYLRKDLVEICRAICELNDPKIISIPTNGLLYERMSDWTPKILQACIDNDVKLVVNLSLDDVGKFHDEIRGVKKNWEYSMKTLSALKNLKEKYPCLTTGIHTVISKYNVHRLHPIVDYILNTLKPDHYIMEVAEERSELFSIGSEITPSSEELKDELCKILDYLKPRYKRAKGISKVSLAFRLRYYELVPKILQAKRQLIPCMASFASCHINPYGEVWACCVLGYEANMGNLRHCDYNFKRLWSSERVEKVRETIRKGMCSCPLANANYTNLLFNFKECLRISVKTLTP